MSDQGSRSFLKFDVFHPVSSLRMLIIDSRFASAEISDIHDRGSLDKIIPVDSQGWMAYNDMLITK